MLHEGNKLQYKIPEPEWVVRVIRPLELKYVKVCPHIGPYCGHEYKTRYVAPENCSFGPGRHVAGFQSYERFPKRGDVNASLSIGLLCG